MSSLPVQPAQPTGPEPIQPPTLTVPLAPELEHPKALLKRSKEVARAVKQFIRENRSMQLTIEGKKYPRAEVWQFAATCFGVTPMVTNTEELLTDDRKEMGYLAIAHAIDRTGRVISGAAAACMCSEPDWAGKPSFQIRSMAETRSCSKVLRNLFGYVMVMAGLCPTPAEEMGPGESQRREITTPCYECGNQVTKKRALAMRRKHGKELCITCEKKMHDTEGERLTAPLNDPKQVAGYVAQVRQRKASGGQPIVAAMDAGKEEIA
jgi:hypothetical protein